MTVRNYELRVYTLATQEALDAYRSVYYPNHTLTLSKLYDVTVHGYWSATGTEASELYVLMSYPEGVNPDEVRRLYRASPEAAANMPGFDPSMIRGVSATMLTPAAGSPLG